MADFVTTIDTDDTSVRLLQTEGTRVVRWAAAPLYAETPEEGEAPSLVEAGPVVRDLLHASAMQNGQVIASMSGLYSVSRILSVPLEEAGASGIAELVRGAIPDEEMQLRFQMLDSAQTVERRLLVQGAPASAVDERVAFLRMAGMNPSALELKGIALTRAVGKREAIIAHVERASMDIVIVTGGVPHVMRTQALATSWSGSELRDHVARELVRTVNFHNKHHARFVLPKSTPFFVVGPEAVDGTLAKTIQAEMDYPYQEFEPDWEYPPSLPTYEYAVNLGLALRNRAPSAPQAAADRGVPLYINLAPVRRSTLRLSPARAGAAGMALVALAIVAVLYGQLAQARTETQRLVDVLAPIAERVDAQQAEIGRVSQMESSIKEFDDLTAPWGHVGEVRELLESTVTEGVVLSSLDIQGNEVRLSARAGSIPDAIAFVEALRATGRFEGVTYTSTSTEVSQKLKLLDVPGQ